MSLCSGVCSFVVGDWLLFDFLHGEREAATIVDGDEFDFDLLANLEDITDIIDALVGDLGDVKHTINPRHDVHEGPKVFNGNNGAIVNFANFWLFGERANPVDGFFDLFWITARDGDETRVFDVDGSSGFAGDLVDGFATFADNSTDFIGRDHKLFDARGILRDLGAWSW